MTESYLTCGTTGSDGEKGLNDEIAGTGQNSTYTFWVFNECSGVVGCFVGCTIVGRPEEMVNLSKKAFCDRKGASLEASGPESLTARDDMLDLSEFDYFNS